MNSQDPDQVVCFCHFVTVGQLLAAIREGADTLAKVQEKTCASTGCGGCQWEVEQILADALAAKSPE